MTTKTDGGPVTPDEAEALAINAVRQYLGACRLTRHDQMGNHLMKLCSVAGVMMALAEGSEGGAQRLEATAAFIRRKMPAEPARMEPLQ